MSKTPEQVAMAARNAGIKKTPRKYKYRKEKAPDQTTIEEDAPKTRVAEIYRDAYTMQNYVTTKDFWERFAVEMLKWYRENPLAITVKSYLLVRGVPYNTYQKAVLNYEILNLAHKELLTLLDDRRHHDAYYNKANASFVARTQHLYDPEWDKHVNEYHAQLKKIENAEQSKILVVKVPSFEEKKNDIMVEEDPGNKRVGTETDKPTEPNSTD